MKSIIIWGTGGHAREVAQLVADIEAYQPGSPGNTSDGVVLSLQIDYAAQAERAFRARTTQTFPRALAHLSTREKGHGQDTGAFTGQALNYFTAIIKQGSEGKGGAI